MATTCNSVMPGLSLRVGRDSDEIDVIEPLAQPDALDSLYEPYAGDSLDDCCYYHCRQ